MNNTKICVIGLGYVGLPLARLFSTKYKTVGFDMNQRRVDALMQGHDATLEVADDLLQDAINNHGFKCTTNLEDIKDFGDDGAFDLHDDGLWHGQGSFVRVFQGAGWENRGAGDYFRRGCKGVRH